ncbi:hypothetical protein QVD17_16958 [Tagetes erecta]|uniref:Uncharacterized protein n=1 Tax=Tagetes erecta TaxID=13708 RepID=A0AAD8NTW4_TARER|nr:hypothetical protein QVD17_16958 [Tagetes erecta]
MLQHPQQQVVEYTHTKASPLSAYTGVVPKIAQICPKGKRKPKVTNLEEKSQEMWKRVFFNKDKCLNSKIRLWFFK